MDSQLTMYITLVSVSGVFNIFLTFYVFSRRKETPLARTFIIYTIAAAIYSFGYAFGLNSNTTDEVMFWTVIQYLGMPFASALGLLIIIEYLGFKPSKAVIAALFFIPVVTWIMVATNDYHHLFYKSFVSMEGMPISFIEIEIGQWYIVHGIYTFSSMLAAFLLLLGRWKQTQRAYRPHLIILISGQLLPMVTAFLYLIGVTPVGLDPVPLVMCITSLLYIWAIMSSNMLVVIPIAKETIFDSMEEGVIVLDSSGRIIDYNPSISNMLPLLKRSTVGQSINEIWTKLTGATFQVSKEHDNRTEDVQWTYEGVEQHYHVRTNILYSKKGEEAGYLIMFINISELKSLQKQLEHQAFYDGLTQVYNRAQFLLLSQQALEASYQHTHPFSMILFDVDYFKRVNDEYGHAVGDQLLVHIAAIAQQLLPDNVIFARYGGEEFVVTLPSFLLEEAATIAEKLRLTLEKSPLQMDEGPLHISASFGVVQANTSEAETLDQLLRKVDILLYDSKRNGRNCVTA